MMKTQTVIPVKPTMSICTYENRPALYVVYEFNAPPQHNRRAPPSPERHLLVGCYVQLFETPGVRGETEVFQVMVNDDEKRKELKLFDWATDPATGAPYAVTDEAGSSYHAARGKSFGVLVTFMTGAATLEDGRPTSLDPGFVRGIQCKLGASLGFEEADIIPVLYKLEEGQNVIRWMSLAPLTQDGSGRQTGAKFVLGSLFPHIDVGDVAEKCGPKSGALTFQVEFVMNQKIHR